MKLPSGTDIFCILILLFSLPQLPQAAEMGNRGRPEAASAQPPAANSASLPPALQKNEEKHSGNGPNENPNDIQVLKQRYNRDATGVRARLGMCRKEQGGPGGHHRRHRGGEQWNNH
jgi:hypothetical protein